jgi:hypothetical protein
MAPIDTVAAPTNSRLSHLFRELIIVVSPEKPREVFFRGQTLASVRPFLFASSQLLNIPRDLQERTRQVAGGRR